MTKYSVEVFPIDPANLRDKTTQNVRTDCYFDLPDMHSALTIVLDYAGDDGSIYPVASKEAGIIKHNGAVSYHYFIFAQS